VDLWDGEYETGVVPKIVDIVQAAVYFWSDESKYVSGQNFAVDGGLTSMNNSFGLFKQEPWKRMYLNLSRMTINYGVFEF